MSRGFIPPKFQTPAPLPAPPRTSKKRFSSGAIIFLVILATSAGVAAFLIFKNSGEKFSPNAQNANSIPATSTVPVSMPKPSIPLVSLAESPATAVEVQKMFNDFVVIAAAKDGEGMGKFFDGPRIFDSAREVGLLSHLAPNDRDYAARLFANADARDLAKSGMLAYDEITVYKVLALRDPTEVLVLTRNHILKTNRREKWRWWLRKSSGTWRIYDMEDLNGFYRHFEVVVTRRTLHEAPGEIALPWTRYLDAFLSYRKAVYGLKRPQSVGGSGGFDITTFPRPLQAAMLMTRGENEWVQNRPAQALALFDQAETMGLDTPRIHRMRASAHNDLNQSDRAIEAARRYIELVGDDAGTYVEIGTANLKLRREDEVLEAYRKGLIDDPDNKTLKDGLHRFQQR